MNEEIEVHLHWSGVTSLIGRLWYTGWERRPSSVFEYDGYWLANTTAFSLDPANLPLSPQPHHTSFRNSGLPGALRDTAPDRWGRLLVDRKSRKTGKTRPRSEIDYLLAMHDRSRVGAIRLRRPGESAFVHDIGARLIPPVVQLPMLLNAADAVHEHSETAEDLRFLLNEGSPLGGARPKATVVDQDDALSLAKFPKPDDTRSIPHGEILALELARKAGINVAGGRVVQAAGRPVALIRRFDRVGENRIPFLSAMSLLNLTDGDEAAYTDIAEIIRRFSSAPIQDLHELWRRVVFSILIGNEDDHLRNHGFLYDCRDQWRLSPAYDINPVPAEQKRGQHATWISEEGADADVELALRAVPYFALDHVSAKQTVEEVSAALTGWRQVARGLGMSASDIEVYSTAINVAN